MGPSALVPGTLLRRALLLLLAALLAGCTTAPPPAARAADDDPVQRLVGEVSGDGALPHLEALQRIADANGGNRASPGPGSGAGSSAGRRGSPGSSRIMPNIAFL